MIPVPYFSSCADKGYDFSIGKFDKFVFVGRPMIAYVNGGVPPYTWSQQGNEFDIANLVTSSQFNRIVTNDKTVVGESADKITVVDSCSHRISFVIKCCSTYLCCDQQTIVFSVDAVEQQPVSDSVLKVYGGCPPFRWESQDPRAHFITEWTEVRQNILMYDDLSENLAYLRYQVTDHCGNVAANIVYYYIFSPPEHAAGVGEYVCWLDDGSPLGRFYRLEYWTRAVDVSADGGYTWTNVFTTTGSPRGIDCVNGAVYAWGSSYLHRSTDGINWSTVFDGSAGSNTVRSVAYNSALMLYVMTTSVSGGVARAWSSPDGITWTERQVLYLYTSTEANTAFKGKHYLIGTNNNHIRESTDCLTWVNHTGDNNPFDFINSTRSESTSDGSYLYISEAKFNGKLWSAWDHIFSSIDYRAVLGFIMTKQKSSTSNVHRELKIVSPSYEDILTIDNGANQLPGYPALDFRDCCWGKDRWLAVTNNGGAFGVVFGKFS